MVLMPISPTSSFAALERTRALMGRAWLRPVQAVLVLSLLSLSAPEPAAAQGKTSSALSTADGIYTAAQAKRGADVYAGRCQSCHTAASHTGPPFRNRWVGRPLSELFDYIIREMPKTEPGTLTMENYTVVLAYMLRMNGMPAGRRALTSDAKALKSIRIRMPTDNDASAAAVR